MGEKRLARAQQGRLCCGVAAGLAGYWGVDVVVVRLFFVVTTLCCGGLGLLLYALLWLWMPPSGELEKREAA